MEKRRSAIAWKQINRAIQRCRVWLRSVFALTTSQANGLLVLIPLLFLLVISEPAWRWWRIAHWKPDPRDTQILDSLVINWQLAMKPSTDSVDASGPSKLFQFDPNTATVAQMMALGLNERLSRRIENYRSKGGVFRERDDLLKIYGMDSTRFQQLSGYIQIAKKPSNGSREKIRKPGTRYTNRHWDEKTRASANSNRFAVRIEEPFDLNLADTARLEAVRGIGEKLSRRIIKYRSSLGGFVQVGQLAEVFGIDSTTMEQLLKTAFVAPDFLPDRIDLNTANEKQLDAHPYLNRQEARAIVAYRFQHGSFNSVSDLGKLPMFNEEKVRRLEPYLKAIN